MGLLLYNIFIQLYKAGIFISSFFNPKAKKWLEGRKDWRKNYKPHPALGGTKDQKTIWIHCSSLGEFEQGRPLVEKIKIHPAIGGTNSKIVLTFFSPSGFEVQKNYSGADQVFYLPMDGKQNAKDFIELINPSLAIFIKYEFWYYYLDELKRRNIPTLLVSAAFRPSQPFFKWYGGFFRKMLGCFTMLFVQDEASKKLLEHIGLKENVFVAGDTRYDRVADIEKQLRDFRVIESFKGNSRLLIAGSTWPDDEKILKECLSILPDDWKLIIAPHEIDEPHLEALKTLFGDDALFYSKADEHIPRKKLMIIDNIGMLSSLYRYGSIAYIGGGFQKGGIHNILEPAVFGLPVLFGPVYEKFVEAKVFVEKGFAFPVSNSGDLKTELQELIKDPDSRRPLSDNIKAFMQESRGAVVKIMRKVDESNLLQ